MELKTAKMILFFTGKLTNKLVTTTVYTAYIFVILVKEYNMHFSVGRKIIGQICQNGKVEVNKKKVEKYTARHIQNGETKKTFLIILSPNINLQS